MCGFFQAYNYSCVEIASYDTTRFSHDSKINCYAGARRWLGEVKLVLSSGIKFLDINSIFFPPFSSTTRSPLPRRNTREHVCIRTVHETRRKSSFGILSTNVRYVLATDDNIISSGNDARYKRAP